MKRNIEQQKIKKGPEHLSIELIRNPDIVATVATREPRPFTVGFAAETNDVLSYAKAKLERKGLDMIVANDVSGSETGFNSDDNEVIIVWPDGEEPLERAAKSTIARQIVKRIATSMTANV